MSDYQTPPGKTTIAHQVLLTIASLAALQVPGVSRLSIVPGQSVNRLLHPDQLVEGVHIEVKDDAVFADLYVVLNHDVNAREVGREIQHEVARAISEMVGLNVGKIDVHIEDIDYPGETEAA